MRKLITLLTIVLIVATIPLSAFAVECDSDSISWNDGHPQLDSELDYIEGVRTSLNGTFFWFELEGEEIVSVEVPDGATSVTFCDDSSITFLADAVQLERVDDIYALYADVLRDVLDIINRMSF